MISSRGIAAPLTRVPAGGLLGAGLACYAYFQILTGSPEAIRISLKELDLEHPWTLLWFRYSPAVQTSWLVAPFLVCTCTIWSRTQLSSLPAASANAIMHVVVFGNVIAALAFWAGVAAVAIVLVSAHRVCQHSGEGEAINSILRLLAGDDDFDAGLMTGCALVFDTVSSGHARRSVIDSGLMALSQTLTVVYWFKYSTLVLIPHPKDYSHVKKPYFHLKTPNIYFEGALPVRNIGTF